MASQRQGTNAIGVELVAVVTIGPTAIVFGGVYRSMAIGRRQGPIGRGDAGLKETQ